MGPSVIQAEQLGKRYRIGVATEPYATLRGALSSAVLRRADSASNGSELWALRDVELDVREGESVGIIGSNGAGKTTLLKLLTRITQPTTGVVRHRGRIGALLEVGTGFHPELTGRENVYLNGAILGMRKGEIDRKLDEIVTFSEVERFIDTPVKRFSTGMRMRLAFAVAAHVEPEILVVDEVLAVGDVAFQRKCLGRMGSVAREGRTVMFVSHNLTAIESLCDRVCWIDRGRLVADGTPGEVIPKYLSSAGSTSTDRAWEDPESAPGTEWLKVRRARVYPENGSPSDPITVDTPFVLEFEYENLDPGVYLNLSLHLFTAEGTLVLNAVPVREGNWYGRPYPAGRFRDRCFVPGQLLNDGRYRVELMAVKDQSVVVHQDSAVLEFDVHDVVEKRGLYEGEWSGIVRPTLGWRTEHLD
jgi:lipopolysaccharide transport system ATP-binding protein